MKKRYRGDSSVSRFVRARAAQGALLALAAALPLGCATSAPEDTEAVVQTVSAVGSRAPSAAEAQRAQAFIDARYLRSDVKYSFHTLFGQTIDCIDFFAQSGVKALAARGTPITKIPTAPIIDQKGPPSDVEFNGKLDDEGNPRACPANTVPQVRITANEIQAAGGLTAYVAAQERKPSRRGGAQAAAAPSSAAKANDPPPPQAGVCTQQFGLDYPNFAHVQQTYNNSNLNNITGGSAYLSIFIPSPQVPFAGGHTVAQIWMYSGWGANGLGCTCGGAGEPACTQSVEAGWEVEPSRYSNTNPHFFTFSTNDGYHTGCWGGSTCNSPAPVWVNQPGALLAPGTIISNGAVNGAQHELNVQIANLNTGSSNDWWVKAGVDSTGSIIGFFPGSAYTGAMKTSAQTFQGGGEVYDPQSTWGMPMGSGATPSAGYAQAAWVRDMQASGNHTTFSPMANGRINTVPGNYNYSTAPAAGGAWSNYFYYGNMPSVFWGQNYGYQWTPVGDWANGSFKGECGMNGSPVTTGTPLIGLSSYPSGSRQPHAVQCAAAPVATTGSSCYARTFNPGNNMGTSGDWDSGFAKANCAANEYVQGVSQSTSGKINGILCCPSSNATHNTCATEVFYGQNSNSFNASGVDWDAGYFKAQCAVGKFVAGVSAIVASANGVVGAPHAIQCCSLN